MSDATMDTMSPYRDRIVECAGNVADTFSTGDAIQFYMAGVRLGADLMMAAALMEGHGWFKPDDAAGDYSLYAAFLEDFKRIETRKEESHEPDAETAHSGLLANAS